MFDIGFTELLVIGVVALLVIGPERLPKVARTAGQWLGRLNRYVSQVKQDINRDMQLEELRKMQQQMQDTAQKYEIMATDMGRQAEETVAQEVQGVNKLMQAMSVTDGGLTQREFDKLQAEQAERAAAALEPATAPALPEAAGSPTSTPSAETPPATASGAESPRPT